MLAYLFPLFAACEMRCNNVRARFVVTIFFCLALVSENDMCDIRANFDNNVQPLRFLLLTAPCFGSNLNH